MRDVDMLYKGDAMPFRTKKMYYIRFFLIDYIENINKVILGILDILVRTGK